LFFFEKKIAGRDALLVAYDYPYSSIVIRFAIEAAAAIAPRTCFPPKTWTARLEPVLAAGVSIQTVFDN
jgi:hypothetical protein